MKGILDAITDPSDLKVLTSEELAILAAEIREKIVSITSEKGGHVASSLGAVEIILAVHSLINSPKDKFVFDVGHQAYAHKLVTGRSENFETLRSLDGISGFTRPEESPHDAHASGHASDSLSIALGLAKARDLRRGKEKIVALIGDGALSGGMAFEALNIIGQLQTPMVIILNDNEMSISKNVGGLVRHLGALRSSAQYRHARDASQSKLEESGPVGKAIVDFGRAAKESLKQFVLPRTMIFESLGIICTPPINGHDIDCLKDILATALEADGPVLVHVVTQKGAGYGPAVADPERFHGIGAYDKETGESAKKLSGPRTYTEVFGQAMIREARVDEHVVAITAAMPSGTGLVEFGKEFPDRLIDVGIAEENAVAMAAGMALGGCKPVVAIYSTFLQRAFDQALVNVALTDSSVVFAIDRAGIVGEDGATHQGLYDIAYCRMIPNMKIIAPANEAELSNSIYTALRIDGPVAVRYPRGCGVGESLPATPEFLETGKSVLVREGHDCAVLAFGDRVNAAMEAAEILSEEGIDVRVVNMRWAKPLDVDAIISAAETDLVVTVENGIISGGAGQGVLEVLSNQGLSVPTCILGVNDQNVGHGKPAELLAKLGLDGPGIASAIRTSMV